jgi:hypothetical protein
MEEKNNFYKAKYDQYTDQYNQRINDKLNTLDQKNANSNNYRALSLKQQSDNR